MENILEKISYLDGWFPRKELQEIIDRKEDFIPDLLHIMDDVRKNPVIEEDDYFGHIYASFLLAQFRVKEFFPILIDILKVPGDQLHDLYGDFLTECAGRVLATLFEQDTDTEKIKELIEDPNANEYARGQGLRALVMLTLHEKLDRDEVLAYFEGLLEKQLEAPDSSMVFITEIINWANDLYPDQLYDLIEKVYEADLVDDFMINLTDVQRTLSRNKEEVFNYALKHLHFVDDTIGELENWAAFYKEKPKRPKNTSKLRGKPKPPKVHKTNPAVKTNKVGRNDPCPCGSGKKYKKCCGS